MKLTLTTYNILHGYYTHRIFENLKLLIEKGADIICLQEADASFEEYMNNRMSEFPQWSMRYAHNGKGSNLAILWNTSKMELKTTESVLLPQRSHERRRAAQIAVFFVAGVDIRISNVHLAWEGGRAHRFRQLRFLKDHLDQNPVQHEIICGDFNTFAPAVFRNMQKRTAQEILGKEWKNAFPDLVWSCDISHSVREDVTHTIAAALHALGFRLCMCLDYVFAKNFTVMHGEMLDVPGSDHRPLMVMLIIKNSVNT